MGSHATQVSTEEKGRLSRSLSHGQMTMIALGLAVGTGLFLGSGGAIAIAGPAVIISYAIGSLIAAVIAACAGEMAVRYPVQGGFGTIAGRFLGPYAGYLTRWAYWATMVPLTGAELVAVGKYMGYWYPDIPLWLWVVVSGAIIVALNLTSVKSFGTMEFFLSSIKVIAVIVFIVFGLVLVFFGLPNTPATGLGNLTNDGGFLPNGISSIWISLAVVMFSFGGVELISISAAEAKDPVRSVSSSVKAMMYRLATFYVLAIFVVVAMMPWKQAATLEGEVSSSPFVMVFSALNIPFIAGITNFVVLTAALSGANAALYAATRQMHALAHDSMAPKAFARTTGNGIPALALGLSMVGSLVAVVMAITGVANIFVMMMSLVTVCVLVVWFMILTSYMFFKKQEGNASPFRVWGGRTTAALALLGVLATFAAMFFTQDMAISATVGVAFFAFISIVYFAFVRSRQSVNHDAFTEASDYANQQQ
ncbi:amino acid permease [Rothia terrae]|uniref:amino acid permease n=1 Tax=Rothia terrae TaxID=396015 RepID=UPI0014473DB9|nr:amino acid permease [Rothia terrae]NKZ33721.1 amino acid permease [Rothia terrae]